MTRLASVKYIGRRAGDQPSPVLHAAAGLIAAIWAKCSSTMGRCRMGYPLLRNATGVVACPAVYWVSCSSNKAMYVVFFRFDILRKDKWLDHLS
jgi:hypothetical protein